MSESNIIYDFKTSNRSFIECYQILKNFDVINNKFHLALFDEDLLGVDPHDPTLPPEYEEKILYECSINRWYYLREVVRIGSGYSTPVKYGMKLPALCAHYLHDNCFNFYLEAPRQTCKSVYGRTDIGYDFLFGGHGLSIGLFNYENAKALDNMEGVMEILNNLPPYMRLHRLEVLGDKENMRNNVSVDDDGNAVDLSVSMSGVSLKIKKEEKTRKQLINADLTRNRISARTPGTTKVQADRAGRGDTYHLVWDDEPGFTANLKIMMNALIPATVTAGMNASKEGNTYGIILSSTPPDVDSDTGRYLLEFVKENMAVFNLIDFDKTREQLLDKLRKKSKNNFFYITFGHRLIFAANRLDGNIWYEKQLAGLEMKYRRRDIELIWDRMIVDSPYDEADLTRIQAMTLESKFSTVDVDNMDFKFYASREYIYNNAVLIGTDIGEGLSIDSTAFVGIDLCTSATLFTFRSNALDTRQSYKFIKEFIEDYCPKGILVVERNGPGKGTVDNIMDDKVLKHNNMFAVKTDINRAFKVSIAHDDPTMKGYEYGFRQYKGSRETIFNNIVAERTRDYKSLIRCNDIYNQITNLTMKEMPGGKYRIDHKSGTHDDLVMAWGIALYVLLTMNKDIFKQFRKKYHIPILNMPTDDMLLDIKGASLDEKLQSYVMGKDEYSTERKAWYRQADLNKLQQTTDVAQLFKLQEMLMEESDNNTNRSTLANKMKSRRDAGSEDDIPSLDNLDTLIKNNNKNQGVTVRPPISVNYDLEKNTNSKRDANKRRLTAMMKRR